MRTQPNRKGSTLVSRSSGHRDTELFQFPAYKKAGALLNTRYEVSDGRPVPIAAPRRSDAAAIEGNCNRVQGIRPRVADRLDYGHKVCGEIIRCLRLCTTAN